VARGAVRAGNVAQNHNRTTQARQQNPPRVVARGDMPAFAWSRPMSAVRRCRFLRVQVEHSRRCSGRGCRAQGQVWGESSMELSQRNV